LFNECQGRRPCLVIARLRQFW